VRTLQILNSIVVVAVEVNMITPCSIFFYTILNKIFSN